MLFYLAEMPKELNPDDVTPGVIGFAITAVVAVLAILIGMDLYRRLRKMNYREEIKAEIAAELNEQQNGGDQGVDNSAEISADDANAGDPPSVTPNDGTESPKV